MWRARAYKTIKGKEEPATAWMPTDATEDFKDGWGVVDLRALQRKIGDPIRGAPLLHKVGFEFTKLRHDWEQIFARPTGA